jgi:hypothetical protein
MVSNGNAIKSLEDFRLENLSFRCPAAAQKLAVVPTITMRITLLICAGKPITAEIGKNENGCLDVIARLFR